MYQYIYDFFLSEEKYGKILSLIENRIVDLGLQGRIDRLNLFKNPRESLERGVKRGIRTVVAVGNDTTLNQVINAVEGLDLTVGFIPVGPGNEIAGILGIKDGVEACDCLSNRLIQKIDLGKINGEYFLSSVKALSEEVHLKNSHNCCIRPLTNSRVEIYNLPACNMAANPRDGYLEARFRVPGGGLGRKKESVCESFFPIKKAILESRAESPLLVDGRKTINTPAEIQIAPRKLKIIVGKNRLF